MADETTDENPSMILEDRGVELIFSKHAGGQVIISIHKGEDTPFQFEVYERDDQNWLKEAIEKIQQSVLVGKEPIKADDVRKIKRILRTGKGG